MQLLFDNFEQLADAPNGVQKLRELILQLAVRGKLVEQDFNDKPASILLRKIEKRKNSILGNIAKTKSVINIAYKIEPFEIPKSWLWISLDECSFITMGQSPKSIFYNENREGLPFYQGKADFGELYPTPRKWCTAPQKVAMKGDILISVRAPVGPTNICREESCIGRGLAAISTLNIGDEFYLFYAIRAQESKISKLGSGSTFSAIKHSQLKEILIPFPPLKEQKRIVTKIDQLMALCDQLEKQKEQRDKKRISLNYAALNKLISSREPSAFQKHWQRIVDHFDLLYDVPENVAEVKKAILQLAVMGKLVPQNPDDEPASELLKRIQAEKNKLIREEKIKKEKPLPPIAEDEIPYELPKGWEWIKFGDLLRIMEYGTSQKASEAKIGIPVLRMNNIDNGKIIYNNLKYVEKSIRDLPRLYLEKNDLIFNRTNSYELVGKTAIFLEEDDKYTFASYLIRLSFFQIFTDSNYINLYLNSKVFRIFQIEPLIIQQCGQANVSGSKLKNTLVPLPPLCEQKRIVAKVNALTKLCDELEEKLKQSRQESERLMEAVVHRIINLN